MSIFEYEVAQTAQSFAYEVKGDSAVILRCFSRDSRAEIPERIEGCLVTELGAYAFSEHFEEEKLKEEVRAGRVKLYAPDFFKIGPGQAEKTDDAGSNTAEGRDGNVLSSGRSGGRTGQPVLPPSLCGERLEEIVLPRTIRRVGRYCFYNCGNLRRLEFHGELSDWGSGAFTGCHGVKRLRVYADENGCSHLKDVLDELREELEVEYFMEPAGGSRLDGLRGELEVEYFSGAADGGRAKEASESIAEGRKDGAPGFACLIFPEFYEEGVENTPARILENHVHGSGILYRNCFRGRVLDFAQYDALFPHARAWESGELVLRMALARLRDPQGLAQKVREQYETYLSEHAAETGSWMLGQRDLDGLRFLLALAESRKNDGKRAQNRGSDGKGTEPPDGGGNMSGDRKSNTDTGGCDTEAPSDRAKETKEMKETDGVGLERILLEEASRGQYMEAVSFLMEYERANRAETPSRRHRLEL